MTQANGSRKRSTSSSKTASEDRPVVLVLEGLSGAADCVKASGGEVVETWPTSLSRAADLIDAADWDGLVLTGGGDIDPRLYDQRPHKEVYGVSETRDLVETYALESARARGVPVLGICRGAQIINVEAGGSLRQHVQGHRGTHHPVTADRGTTLRRWAGRNPRVLSLHHQRIERVADGYRVSGRAPDGTIESIEAANGRVLGVQFHPEMEYEEDYAAGIFRWLVTAAADRAGVPVPEERDWPRWRQSHYYDTPSKFHTVSTPTTRRQRRRRRTRGAGPVSVSWICPKCAIMFDDQQDRDDHVALLHTDGGYFNSDETGLVPGAFPDELIPDDYEVSRALGRLRPIDLPRSPRLLNRGDDR